MKISKVLEKLSITFLCFVGLILFKNSTCQAVLQSNGNDGATYNLSNWMMNIRKMEEIGGGMGLSESINSNLTTNGDSNNIDVHMQKNTEYGALAILSASSYGNPNKINNGETTTGNVTGVVMKLNKEWVAAGPTTQAGYYSSAVNRYKNLYYYDYVAKRGDTLAETTGWHGSKSSQWLYCTNSLGGVDAGGVNINGAILRAYSGSIFSYYGYIGKCDWRDKYMYEYADAYPGKTWYSRAVIVSGQGV